MKTILYTILFILLLGYLFFGVGVLNSKKIALSGFDLVDMNGKPYDKSQLKGKPLLVNFWATWCGPCIREKPSLDKARQILEKEGLEFVMISQEELSVIRKYVERKPYQFTYLKSNTPIKLKRIFEIPQTYIIDKNGKITFEFTGVKDWSSEVNIDLIRQYAGLK